jgi:hypothetical protein
MWIEALDLVLARLEENGTPFARIKGISGAGQQHGSVFWSGKGEELLANLNPKQSLVEQLSPNGFSHPFSPNWQDGSTQKECDEFDAVLGGEAELAHVSGSKAHHVSDLIDFTYPSLTVCSVLLGPKSNALKDCGLMCTEQLPRSHSFPRFWHPYYLEK